jgi:hypothetical protein
MPFYLQTAFTNIKDNGEKNVMAEKISELENLKNNQKFQHLEALIKRTDKENPKDEDLAEMKRQLDENIQYFKLNNISEQVFEKAIEICSTSALMREIHRRQISEKRKSLGFETASPIEQILIDQVLVCWFRLCHLEMIHARHQATSHTFASGNYWDKKLSSAQRRMLKACETLSKVQKHLADANRREQQAQHSRRKGAALANKLLKDLTE